MFVQNIFIPPILARDAYKDVHFATIFFSEFIYPLDMEVNKRLIIDCSGFMLVNKVLKHLLGSRSQNTHIGPHLCPHPLGSCRI